MLKFQVSEDQQWIILVDSPDEVEKKQIDISLTKKIHNFYFHPFLLKLKNGEDSPGAQLKLASYTARREKLKQKETMNRTFKLKPTLNRVRQFDENDPEWVRIGNFI